MPPINKPVSAVHEKLYEDASNAINLLFSDNTVSSNVTKDSLQELKEEINIMLQALGAGSSEEEAPDPDWEKEEWEDDLDD